MVSSADYILLSPSFDTRGIEYGFRPGVTDGLLVRTPVFPNRPTNSGTELRARCDLIPVEEVAGSGLRSQSQKEFGVLAPCLMISRNSVEHIVPVVDFFASSNYFVGGAEA